MASKSSRAKQGLYRLAAHHRLETAAVFGGRFAVFIFGKQLPKFERALSGVGNHIILIIDYLLKVRSLSFPELSLDWFGTALKNHI